MTSGVSRERQVVIKSGPRSFMIVGAAFFASFVGAALGAGLAVSVVGPERARPTADALAAAEARGRAIEAEVRRRLEEEAAKRRAEEERAAEEQRRAQEEARRSAPDRARALAGEGVTCVHAAAALKGRFVHDTDCDHVQRQFTLLLMSARDGGETVSWSNPRSGASGTMKVIATRAEADGRMCRSFEQSVTMDGRSFTGAGTACFQGGEWHMAQ
jgi:hypothetical protein